ncbi:MAG TPA: hypothetical protein VL325_05920 [Pyrinomonadaceae bacterium]|nr:hypothetical protein [Pyrinomonadaceae bacterium]
MISKFKLSVIQSVIVVAAVVATAQLVAFGQDYSGSTPTIKGVWQTVVTPKVCNGPSAPVSFPGILLFSQDGTVTGTSTAVTSAYGTWRREPGAANYSFKAISFRYDASQNLLGTRVIWQNATLTDGGDKMTTDGGFTDYDKNGVPVASGCSTATGTRFE